MGDTRFSSEKFEKLCIVIIAILFFIVVFKTITSPKKIYTVSLPEKTEQGTLAVTANGDKELPEIVSFISPSGKELPVDNKSITVYTSDQYSSYQISNAECGVWKVNYRLGKNTNIDFTLQQQ